MSFLPRLWAALPLLGRLLITASLALLVAGLALLYTSAERDAVYARFDLQQALAHELETLPTSIVEILVIGDFATLNQILQRHVTRREIAWITFRDTAGVVVESRSDALPLLAPAWFVAWLGVDDVVGQTSVDVGGRIYGSLELGLTARQAINRSWERLGHHLGILLLAITLELLGILWILHHGLRPLRVLDEGSRALAQGKLDTRIAPVGSPDIRRSIHAFNQMAEALQLARTQLLREKERWHVTLASISEAVITVDRSGRIELMNAEAQRLTGWSEQEALAKEVNKVLRLLDEAQHNSAKITPLETALQQGYEVHVSNHTLLVARDGSIRPIADSAAPIRTSADGVVTGAVMVFRDQTHERQRLNTLRTSQARLAAVLRGFPGGMLIEDERGSIMLANLAFCELFGLDDETPEALVGQSYRDKLVRFRTLVSDSAAFDRCLDEVDNWRRPMLREPWYLRDGRVLECDYLPILVDGQFMGNLWLYRDVTQLRQHEQQLEQIAHYDVLTRVPNRILLADRMQRAIAQTQRAADILAVCYIDLDGFKPINDTYGHEAGDRMLVEISRRLSRELRGGDTVARLGGDEFVLLLLGFERVEQCEAILTRLLETIAEPMALPGEQIVGCSASIGVALYPPDEGDSDTLLRHADQAMYLAKQAGRSRYHIYDIEHDRQTRSHRQTLERIRQALDNGEFKLYYQPQVNMRTGHVSGAEALIRWQDPQRGLLAPDEFLPVIQNSDLEITLGEWVLDEALEQLALWRRAGIDLEIGVNISAAHLQWQPFVSRLAERWAKCSLLRDAQLQLEILETAALQDLSRAAEIIEECRLIGITFALDDFGTGYSSLSYLKRLPVETLKIDQSFIRDMLKDPEDLAIVEGVIALSEAFGRSVIAEGVESTSHGLLLLRLGCVRAQGYGIARPMPAEELTRWIEAWKPPHLWELKNLQRWPTEDFPLFLAEYNHNEWVRKLIGYVRGELPMDTRTLAAAFDPKLCRFGRWYYGSGQARYGHLPEHGAIETSHAKLHTMSHDLVQWVKTGQREQALRELPALYQAQDDIIEKLHLLEARILQLHGNN